MRPTNLTGRQEASVTASSTQGTLPPYLGHTMGTLSKWPSMQQNDDRASKTLTIDPALI